MCLQSRPTVSIRPWEPNVSSHDCPVEVMWAAPDRPSRIIRRAQVRDPQATVDALPPVALRSGDQDHAPPTPRRGETPGDIRHDRRGGALGRGVQYTSSLSNFNQAIPLSFLSGYRITGRACEP